MKLTLDTSKLVILCHMQKIPRGLRTGNLPGNFEKAFVRFLAYANCKIFFRQVLRSLTFVLEFSILDGLA